MTTTQTEVPEIENLPPFVSVKRTGEVLCISRTTIWRRIKDGTLQIASGSGKITKASIQRFAQPRAYSRKSELSNNTA